MILSSSVIYLLSCVPMSMGANILNVLSAKVNGNNRCADGRTFGRSVAMHDGEQGCKIRNH